MYKYTNCILKQLTSLEVVTHVMDISYELSILCTELL